MDAYTGVCNSIRLGYSEHIDIIHRVSHIKKTEKSIIKKLHYITRSVIRLINLTEPLNEIVHYQINADHILLKYFDDAKNYTDYVFNSEKISCLISHVDGVFYFAPWIYEYIQKSSRILIYKNIHKYDEDTNRYNNKINYLSYEHIHREHIHREHIPHENPEYSDFMRKSYTEKNSRYRYLVHRSYPDGNLQHPGGHLEYIEFYNMPHNAQHNTKNKTYYSTAISYVDTVLKKIIGSVNNYDNNNNKNDNNNEIYKSHTDINATTKLWMLYGGVREVMEESGLDLRDHLHNIVLRKIGSKTFYFSVEVDSDIFEKGPLEDYRSEIMNHNITNKMNNRLELNMFWSSRVNYNTDHAWISSTDMLEYWDSKYMEHIKDMIDIIEK